MKDRVNFGEKVVLKVTTPAPDLEPQLPEGKRKVQLSTRVEEDTYIGLKQAKYWVPGMVEEDFINAAIVEKLARTEGADKPLPPMELAKLRQKKKLRG